MGWLGLLPAWRSVLGPALTIDPLSQSVCPSTHQSAGAPEAGGAHATMWVLIALPASTLLTPGLRCFLKLFLSSNPVFHFLLI
jgi:hypothetical protein